MVEDIVLHTGKDMKAADARRVRPAGPSNRTDKGLLKRGYISDM
jgi:hypothetical protein